MDRERLDCAHCKSAGSVEHGVCQLCLRHYGEEVPVDVLASIDGSRSAGFVEVPVR
ncbi:MAG: hypothetical protein ACXVQS_09620 [Actinomycetota bacterium]